MSRLVAENMVGWLVGWLVSKSFELRGQKQPTDSVKHVPYPSKSGLMNKHIVKHIVSFAAWSLPVKRWKMGERGEEGDGVLLYSMM